MLKLTTFNGSTPLGYLASLGVLRVLDLARPGQEVRLSWDPRDLSPQLHTKDPLTLDVLEDILVAGWQAGYEVLLASGLELYMKDKEDKEALGLSAEQYKTLTREASASPNGRTTLEVLSSLRSEVDYGSEELGKCRSGMVTLNGTQNLLFLRSLRGIAPNARAVIHASLTTPWQFADRGFSLKLDPREYVDLANISGKRIPEGCSEHGANLLAAAGIAMYPCFGSSTRTRTTGFDGRALFWPLWDTPLRPAVARRILAMRAVVACSNPRHAEALRALGVFQVFEAPLISKIMGQTKSGVMFGHATSVLPLPPNVLSPNRPV